MHTNLADASVGDAGIVAGLCADRSADAIDRRLCQLGLTPGACFCVVQRGRRRNASLAVDVNGARFGLRASEARRLLVRVQHA